MNWQALRHITLRVLPMTCGLTASCAFVQPHVILPSSGNRFSVAVQSVTSNSKASSSDIAVVDTFHTIKSSLARGCLLFRKSSRIERYWEDHPRIYQQNLGLAWRRMAKASSFHAEANYLWLHASNNFHRNLVRGLGSEEWNIVSIDCRNLSFSTSVITHNTLESSEVP